MTVLRDKKEPLTSLTYSEGYDLGMQDYSEGKPRRATRPRNANGSAGRFGYADGYSDAMERATGWGPMANESSGD